MRNAVIIGATKGIRNLQLKKRLEDYGDRNK